MMSVKGWTFVLLGAALVVLGTGAFLLFWWHEDEREFRLVPVPRPQSARAAVPVGPGRTRVGTGSSAEKDPKAAVHEALTTALGPVGGPPDFLVLFATSGSDLRAILAEVRWRVGQRTRVFGGTCDVRGVMTDRGFIPVSERGYELDVAEGKRGLAMMAVVSDEIQFGTGSADFTAYPSVEAAAEAALRQAIASAGKTPDQVPSAVLTSPTIGDEEEVLVGIENVIGTTGVVVGGTLAGPEAGAFGDTAVHDRGVSLAVLYTDLPIGWTFEGGFDVTEPRSGVVTKMDRQTIVEIDGRPALDVYDEWLGGRIAHLLEEEQGRSDRVRDLLTLHPLYRTFRSPGGQDYFLFSHPWPKDPTLRDRAVATSTKIQAGETVNLSRGTWDILMNRVGNLPRNAMIQGGMSIGRRPLFGIGCVCGGVLGVIPPSERAKLPLLINQTNHEAPFVANFTWGEQGHFPGIGNRHGNLLSAFLVVGAKG